MILISGDASFIVKILLLGFFKEITRQIRAGKYRHFKGAEVKVLSEARHSETQEKMVVYKHLDTGEIWIRPKKMFLEKVVIDGKRVPRFEHIGS